MPNAQAGGARAVIRPSGDDDGPAGAEVDGRRLRRQQNRSAVIDALLALFADGVYTPSTGEIAERAGCSLRSLFRYFDDVDDLFRAAIERHQRRYRSLTDPGVSPDEPTDRKVRRVVEARVRLFEAIAPSARAARVWAHRHQTVRDLIAQNRAGLRAQLRPLFARELDGRPERFPALDALCAFETYDLLRSDQGLSRRATVNTLAAAVLALVEP